jgi:RimJ/RimL family protein N-acetyltransferase
MIYSPEEITDKEGKSYVLRSLKQEDRDMLVSFITQGALESPHFPWAPGVTKLTADNAGEYILEFENDSRKLLLGAFKDGRLVGLHELSGMSECESMRHRCMVGGGLLKEVQGRGLGKKILMIVAETAKEIGYEQLELSTATDNRHEHLLHLGFQQYGMIPHKSKNKDGSYVDELRFVKWL